MVLYILGMHTEASQVASFQMEKTLATSFNKTDPAISKFHAVIHPWKIKKIFSLLELAEQLWWQLIPITIVWKQSLPKDFEAVKPYELEAGG